ncbi:Crp/Fnr family transcriptional regulator [Pseudanabaena sp. FACHB-2040]|uniref:Crp/Fnr family transcriptional regulator n=1 Tax=Pseudanabaena sp. FACHB-2040 TaxID=2692859 RepID=UPI001681F4AD|nr:Crp/Fnr family transcriptional regulator [Pseudanabaena sp. FACHB-2040]
MARQAKLDPSPDLLQDLIQHNFLFKGLDKSWLAAYLIDDQLVREKLFSGRPIYTAFRPGQSLDYLYVQLGGGPVIIRSTPLDRIVAMTYPGSCFGMRNLDFDFGGVCRTFPSLVEAYKTTDVVKIPVEAVKALHAESEDFRERYNLLFELREKFQYHLLNCSAYPPQAVASLLRALIYQERNLGSQPQANGSFLFDLPIDLIARACQLNHRTVEQVLKGMTQVGLLKAIKGSDNQGDVVCVVDPEGLKEVYGATRDKVSWWPLK